MGRPEELPPRAFSWWTGQDAAKKPLLVTFLRRAACVYRRGTRQGRAPPVTCSSCPKVQLLATRGRTDGCYVEGKWTGCGSKHFPGSCDKEGERDERDRLIYMELHSLGAFLELGYLVGQIRRMKALYKYILYIFFFMAGCRGLI